MAYSVLPSVGGCFALLALLHFVVDWVFQSHDEAMRKPREWRIRARHCAVYTAPFIPIMAGTGWGAPWVAGVCLALFLSHFVEDTYLPVLLWAKYVRRPPEMTRRIVRHDGSWAVREGKEIRAFRGELEFSVLRDVIGSYTEPGPQLREAQRRLDLDGFVTWASGPLGKILLIAVDQIVHLLFLLPAAYMVAVRP